MRQRTDALVKAEIAPEGDQFPELERWLGNALTTSHVAEIQRRRRRALWGSVAEAMTQAIPLAQANHPWQAQTVTQLDTLRATGWQQIKPLIALNAADWAQQAQIGRWPSSPGPFGLVLRAGAGLRDFVSKLARRGVPVQLGPFRGAVPLLSEDDEPSINPNNTALITTDNTGLALLADGTVADVSLALRSANVPAHWLIQRLRAIVATLSPRVGSSIRMALAEAVEQPYSRARRVTGIAVLVLIELALTGVLGLAAWRLINGFWSKDYVNGSFVTNLLMLITLVVFVGMMGLTASFPRPEVVVLSRLEGRLRQLWAAFVGELKSTAQEFASTTQRLLTDGESIKEAINAELRELAPRVGDGDDDFDAVDKLFGQ